MDESRQLRASTGWVSVFVREGHREGGGTFVTRRAELEQTSADVSQPQDGGGGRSSKGK